MKFHSSVECGGGKKRSLPPPSYTAGSGIHGGVNASVYGVHACMCNERSRNIFFGICHSFSLPSSLAGQNVRKRVGEGGGGVARENWQDSK